MAKKEKENQIPVEETAETAEVAEETVETPEVAEVNPWEEKYNAERDAHLRVAAEYDNFRKRTVKEKEASYGLGRADAVAKMLPVYDNLERALNQPTEDAAYKKGVEMTMNELVKIFTSLGVEIFGNAGDEFDPNLHNAVMHVENEELGENTIAQVFQKGFKIGDKVVRFAMVQVDQKAYQRFHVTVSCSSSHTTYGSVQVAGTKRQCLNGIRKCQLLIVVSMHANLLIILFG